MIKRKTFNLSQDDAKSKPSEKLYQPKKCRIFSRWCKYVVIPLLIGFILLLILVNVDFTGNAYKKTILVLNNNSIVIGDKERQMRSSYGIDCFASDDNCALECQGGNTNNLYKQLDPLYALCGNDLELILKNCNFPAGAMKSNFLQGNFSLKTLAIIDCNLGSIKEGAFQQNSVANLKTLQLINTQLSTFTKTTFKGLEALETFNMTNINNFELAQYEEECLQPFAISIKTLRIVQKSQHMVQAVDPAHWLKGEDMKNLQFVDFRDNYFGNILTNRTFATLVRVVTLSLANCSLIHLPSAIFDAMLGTLESLDLSQNQLTTLDSQLLVKLNGLNSLALGKSYWDCSCSNWDILKELRENLVNIVIDKTEVKCVAPPELNDESVFSAELDCEEKETSTETTTNETYPTTVGNSTPSTGETTSDATYETTESWPTAAPTQASTESTKTTGSSTMETRTTETTTTRTTTWTTTTQTSTVVPLPPTIAPPIVICCLDPIRQITMSIALISSQVQFTILPSTATSVWIKVPQQSITFDLIYFHNYSQVVEMAQGSTVAVYERSGYTMHVADLQPGMAYVFCLLTKGHKEVTPFDCKSYYVYPPEPEPWVLDEDQHWIIALVVLAICLCLLMGIIVVFIVLRFRKRRAAKKQLLKLPHASRTSRSNPRNVRVSEIPLTNRQIREAQRSLASTDYIRPQRASQFLCQDHYEEMDY